MQKSFKVPFKNTVLVGDILSDDSNVDLIILHGAGSSNRSRYRKLRESLYQRGVSSCAFDFIGHGETGGELRGSSLEERTEQVLAVLDNLELSPSSIHGSSMGAYTAIRLLEKIAFKNLILQVPAAYSKNAYSVPFGESFSGEIRKEESWKDSDAFEILQKFRGKALFILAENDEVIPKKVIQEMRESLSLASSREQYIVHGAPHAMSRYLAESPEQFDMVVSMIADLIR